MNPPTTGHINRVQMLAASPRPLAEVLIDALRRGTKLPLGNLAATTGDDRDQEQLELRLNDLESGDTPAEIRFPFCVRTRSQPPCCLAAHSIGIGPRLTGCRTATPSR